MLKRKKPIKKYQKISPEMYDALKHALDMMKKVYPKKGVKKNV